MKFWDLTLAGGNILTGREGDEARAGDGVVDTVGVPLSASRGTLVMNRSPFTRMTGTPRIVQVAGPSEIVDRGRLSYK